MTDLLNDIVYNAQHGCGPCEGCPAQEDTGGRLVNPGLLNPDGDIMFLTMDPSHYTDWDQYDDWSKYNEAKSDMFIERAPGGRKLTQLLDPLGYSLDDAWLGDSIKCPANNDRATDVDTATALAHCAAYLEKEIAFVNPDVIVTLGNSPGRGLLLEVFGRDVRIKAGTRDCGRLFDTEPPVVISPHWANSWLDRGDNMEQVRSSLAEALDLSR